VGASIVLICGPTSTGTANIYMLSSTALNILPGSGGGGGAVSSVFGRTGAVTAQTGDYTCAQVTGCVTNAVSSVFGRTGAVVAVSGDYTCTEVTGCVTGGGPAIAGSPVAPPASVTGFNIFGDSLGLGVGVQTSSQVYAQIFANALGLPINNNFSVDGAHQAAFLTQATGVTPSVATGSITIVGAN
jgi:hypothetical protein